MMVIVFLQIKREAASKRDASFFKRLSLLLRQPHFGLKKISLYFCVSSFGDGRLFLPDSIPKRETEQSYQDDPHND